MSEVEVRESPMARMTPPIVPEEPPPILRPEQIKAILDACAGTDFEARRDTALVRMLLDTGMRRGEIAGLRLADVDLEEGVAIVLGKGRRPRACPFGSRTAQAVDRYLRARASHSQAGREELWLGARGVLTDSGVLQVLRRRGAVAGLPTPPPAPVPSHVRPRVAGERRPGGRPHAPRRLALPADAAPLWSQPLPLTSAHGPRTVAEPGRQAVTAS